MRLGLIARCDQSGLAVQTYEAYRHLQPEKTLVINVGHLYNDTTHCNKKSNPELYPGAIVHNGWTPQTDILEQFLNEMEVVFSCETFYNNDLLYMCAERRIRTVLQPNPEFLQRQLRPSLWAAPTEWMWDTIPLAKTLLPVPIATDRFTVNQSTKATNFLHVIGRPAHVDRNGTLQLLQALEHVTSEITLRITCQEAGYVGNLIHDHQIRTPSNVTLIVDSSSTENYWDNYQGDVLIMPRRFGGLCLPVNEALGAGMPVIMTDIPPNNQWLPNEWLIPASHAGEFQAKLRVYYYTADVHALAAKIDQYATDQTFYKQAQTDAQRLRSEYSWDTLKPVYEQVLAG